MGVVNVALSEQEWRVVAGLRELPPSALRELTYQLVVTLLDYAREPKCAEMQADGVPCSTPAADCEQCGKVTELLTVLRRGLA